MRRALVTGGSGAIGSAIARQLARSGVQVLVHASRQVEAARSIVQEITAAGGSAAPLTFDLTDPGATEAALVRVLEDGPVQVIVHAAGVHDDAPLAGMRDDQWARVIDVSLNGFFRVTRPLLLPMLRGRSGRIIALSSIAAVHGNRGQANYAAAKAGLHGAARSLAREVASRGVTVNVVAPGVILSPMTAAVFDQARIEALVPMKRAGTAEEVAAVVGFLASDGASYVSGQVIAVSGGLS